MTEKDILAILGALAGVGLFAWLVLRQPAVVDTRPAAPSPPDPAVPDTKEQVQAELEKARRASGKQP